MQQFLTTFFVVVYALTILGVILVIITGNRNPLKTIPWVIVLILAPVVGLVFYFFFGQDLRKQKIISRRTYKRLMMHPMHDTLRRERGRVPAPYVPLSNLLININHAEVLPGSRLTPYTDGRSKIEALLREIDAAKHHIHLQYYIFRDDRTGCRVQEALIRKAREGVRVRVLYDDVGNSGVKEEFYERMRREGIEIHAFLHVKFPMFTSKVNYRNHRKVAVIDGRVGFIGGMNIANRYVDGPGWGVWRDTHFKVEGKGVYGLQSAFLIDWAATNKTLLSDPSFYPPAEEYNASALQVATSGPFGPWRTLLQAFTFAIANAKRRIFIQTPYFLPSEGLNTALQTAALGGIDVRLMLPERSDSKAVDRAVHSFIDDMVRAGVKVFFYTAGFLHAKLLVIDGTLTAIGSANMDFRSFEHNFEINAFAYDEDFAQRMERIFEDDLKDCKPLVPQQWFRRPRRLRLAESFMRMFSPLL